MAKQTTTEEIYEDIDELSAILEDFVQRLDKLGLANKIDMAARLKPIAKHVVKIDEHVKDLVRTKLDHKDGATNGILFKAVLKLVTVDRLDQKALKEERPKIHAEYLRECTDERVTYEVR
jgi:hypothetical protein